MQKQSQPIRLVLEEQLIPKEELVNMEKEMRVTTKTQLGDVKMIRQNDIRQIENREEEAKRIFTMILNAAEPHVRVFDQDDQNHTARALIETRDAAYEVAIAYDAIEKTFAVVVCLHIDDNWTISKVMIFLRLQNHTAIRSSSINLDLEDSMLRVGSNVPLPEANVVQPIVTSVVKDTIHVLDDDDFKGFIN